MLRWAADRNPRGHTNLNRIYSQPYNHFDQNDHFPENYAYSGSSPVQTKVRSYYSRDRPTPSRGRGLADLNNRVDAYPSGNSPRREQRFNHMKYANDLQAQIEEKKLRELEEKRQRNLPSPRGGILPDQRMHDGSLSPREMRIQSRNAERKQADERAFQELLHKVDLPPQREQFQDSFKLPDIQKKDANPNWNFPANAFGFAQYNPFMANYDPPALKQNREVKYDLPRREHTYADSGHERVYAPPTAFDDSFVGFKRGSRKGGVHDPNATLDINSPSRDLRAKDDFMATRRLPQARRNLPPVKPGKAAFRASKEVGYFREQDVGEDVQLRQRMQDNIERDWFRQAEEKELNRRLEQQRVKREDELLDAKIERDRAELQKRWDEELARERNKLAEIHADAQERARLAQLQAEAPTASEKGSPCPTNLTPLPDENALDKAICPRCKGRGKVKKMLVPFTCKRCKGTGYVPKDEVSSESETEDPEKISKEVQANFTKVMEEEMYGNPQERPPRGFGPKGYDPIEPCERIARDLMGFNLQNNGGIMDEIQQHKQESHRHLADIRTIIQKMRTDAHRLEQQQFECLTEGYYKQFVLPGISTVQPYHFAHAEPARTEMAKPSWLQKKKSPVVTPPSDKSTPPQIKSPKDSPRLPVLAQKPPPLSPINDRTSPRAPAAPKHFKKDVQEMYSERNFNEMVKADSPRGEPSVLQEKSSFEQENKENIQQNEIVNLETEWNQSETFHTAQKIIMSELNKEDREAHPEDYTFQPQEEDKENNGLPPIRAIRDEDFNIRPSPSLDSVHAQQSVLTDALLEEDTNKVKRGLNLKVNTNGTSPVSDSPQLENANPKVTASPSARSSIGLEKEF